MADLSYQDVQRATQDSVRIVQGDIGRLANDIANISARTQRLEDMQRDLQELKVRFEAIEKFCRDTAQYFKERGEQEREDYEYRHVSGM